MVAWQDYENERERKRESEKMSSWFAAVQVAGRAR